MQPSRTVVVATDDDGEREMLGITLRVSGFEVHEAHGGAEVVRVSLGRGTHAPVDAIVCDLRMAEMDGIAVARALRQHRVSAPLVLLTASPLSHEQRVALGEGGATLVLEKPFPLPVLIERLQWLLRP